ncbi:hypothetical protein P9112_010681 [Eukaryota sp. TZLM1-RC]
MNTVPQALLLVNVYLLFQTCYCTTNPSPLLYKSDVTDVVELSQMTIPTPIHSQNMSEHSISRAYPYVCDSKPQSYWDYENIKLKWSSPSNYDVVYRIGGGRYSDVYKAIDSRTEKKVAMKVLKPVKTNKIKREVKILQTLTHGPNIVKLLDTVRDAETDAPSLVMEYVKNTELKKWTSSLSLLDIKCYIYQLLLALEHCHSHGIMHRDVKPGNVVFDYRRHQLRLIDFGLAEFYHSGYEYGVRVATRYYKAPELLVGLSTYDYSIDMWSVGCILAGLQFGKQPFFEGVDNEDQLLKIVEVLGSDGLFEFCEKYNLKCDSLYDVWGHDRVSWITFLFDENEHLVTTQGLDLLDKILVYDHWERLTAGEALSHPFFDDVRND